MHYTHPACGRGRGLRGAGRPDRGGDRGLVTLEDGATATEEEIRGFVEERLAVYTYPRIVRLGVLPTGPTGKILNREISLDG